MEFFKDYTIFPKVLVYHDNEEFEWDDTRSLFFDLNKKEYLSIHWNVNKNDYSIDKHDDNEDYPHEELKQLMLFLK